MTFQPAFSLRHDPGPFLSLGLVFGSVLALFLWTCFRHPMAFRMRDMGLIAVGIVGGYFGITSFYWRYRIRFNGVAITQHAPGTQPITIELGDIERVSLEVGSPIGRWRGVRPLRRIAIYTKHANLERPFIDVSLKHFLADDIRRLIREIHQARPDLALPDHWA